VSKAGKDIQILYNGRKIENFALYQFRISNPGGRPIRTADYEESVSLSFQNVREIVSAQQTASDPPSLKMEPTIDNSRVIMPPALLNPSDSCSIEVAVIPTSSDKPSVEIFGRIAGIKNIQFTDPEAIESAKRMDVDRARRITFFLAFWS
jgi:hypothetical protein